MKKERTRSGEIRGIGRAAREMYLIGTTTGRAGLRNMAAYRPREFFREGIIALPLMLLISGIVLEMTIASTLIVFYLLQGSAGARNAAEALTTAQSGVNDASVQLARNMSFGNTYSLTLDAQHVAQITVCNQGHKTTSCTASGGCTVLTDLGKVEITSLGTVKGSNRCARAVYNVNTDTGEIKLESSGEIAL